MSTGSPVGAGAQAGRSAALDDRYGRRSRPGLRRWLLAGLVVLLAAWAALVTVQKTTDPVQYEVTGFEVVDAGSARVTFTVLADPGTAVVCTVRVLNSALTDVGREDVTVGPADTGSFVATVTILTYEEGASARIRACAVA